VQVIKGIDNVGADYMSRIEWLVSKT
jgi:hypothetical protein